jgi:hypothetical protein
VTCGYTLAERAIVTLADDSRVFVKAAVDETTASDLREEHRIYSGVTGSFMPEVQGWHDDGERPVLVLEDLSAAHWPPPWSTERIEAMLEAFDELHRVEPPASLIRLSDTPEEFEGWRRVAADPEPFLALGLASPKWLERALPELVEAESRIELEGDALLHMDNYGENICFHEGSAKLVDWSAAAVGPPLLDLATWVTSLYAEGGPPPWELLPGESELASAFTGVWAHVAGQPPPPWAPGVRSAQRTILAAALKWTTHELGLDPAHGT